MVGRKLMPTAARRRSALIDGDRRHRLRRGRRNRRAAGGGGGPCSGAATDWMVAAEIERPLSPVPQPYLRAFALTLGGHYLLKAALAEGEDEAPDAAGGVPDPPAAFRRPKPSATAACEGALPRFTPLDLAS